MIVDRSCKLCGNHTSKMYHCSICTSVSYCSKECQEKDWKDHKTQCKRLVELKQKIIDSGLRKATLNKLGAPIPPGGAPPYPPELEM
jgi:hypothetical protein